jgi:hypothetical protein
LKSNLLSAVGVLSRTVYRYFSLPSFCTTVVFVIFVIFAVIIVVLNSSAVRTGVFIEYGMYVPTYLQCTLQIYISYELPGWKRVLHEKLIIRYLFHKFYFILWNLKVHDCLYNNSPLVPILSQINPLHTLLPCLLNLGSMITAHKVFFRVRSKLSRRSQQFRYSLSSLPYRKNEAL